MNTPNPLRVLWRIAAIFIAILILGVGAKIAFDFYTGYFDRLIESPQFEP